MPAKTKIKHIREVKGIKACFVAAKLMVSKQYFSMMENGSVNIPDKYLIELAKFYNVHPNELKD